MKDQQSSKGRNSTQSESNQEFKQVVPAHVTNQRALNKVSEFSFGANPHEEEALPNLQDLVVKDPRELGNIAQEQACEQATVDKSKRGRTRRKIADHSPSPLPQRFKRTTAKRF